MGCDPPLVRQWIVLQSLCSRGRWLTVRELADESGVSEKTIRRDLATLRSVGFPIEEETGEFDKGGNPKIRRRKADDEHLIRYALLQSRLIDAVISLPLNVF